MTLPQLEADFYGKCIGRSCCGNLNFLRGFCVSKFLGSTDTLGVGFQATRSTSFWDAEHPHIPNRDLDIGLHETRALRSWVGMSGGIYGTLVGKIIRGRHGK